MPYAPKRPCNKPGCPNLESSSGIDELSARTSAGTAGFSMTSGNNQFAVIEVDASELPSGQSYLLVGLEDKSNLISVTAVLSGARQKYPGSAAVQS